MGVDILIELVYKIRIVLVNKMPKDLYSELLGHLRTNIYTILSMLFFFMCGYLHIFISPAR